MPSAKSNTAKYISTSNDVQTLKASECCYAANIAMPMFQTT